MNSFSLVFPIPSSNGWSITELMPAISLNPKVDPVQEARYPNIKSNAQWKELLEIRRERRVELALEGYRIDDLNRFDEAEHRLAPDIVWQVRCGNVYAEN
jgi:hypothetical protein